MFQQKNKEDAWGDTQTSLHCVQAWWFYVFRDCKQPFQACATYKILSAAKHIPR